MRLGDLVPGELVASLSADERAIDIAGLTADSRDVEKGFLFAALPGARADGANFISEALKRGAAAVLGLRDAQSKLTSDTEVLLLQDANPRRTLAQMAARFYPRQPRTIVAITGTNGKTSVASFARQLWERLGDSSASIGTLGVQAGGSSQNFGLTTPDPVALHRALAQLASAGIEHVAMEASSHGLAQYRLDGVNLAAAAITNLTRDHLDYHEDVEAYAYAKLRLFGELLAPGRTAVVNAESGIAEDAQALAWARGHAIMTVGRAGCTFALIAHEASANGQRLTVEYGGARYDIALPLVGLFQAWNALMAAALVIATGSDAGRVFAALAQLKGVPGRLELAARSRSGAFIYVDYAHTPDALRAVLETLRPHVQGRLHLVFGCGGDRDRGKRPQMGRIAMEHADCVIVTDDNPRSEDAGSIRADIIAETPGAREIGDRKDAITTAIAGLQTGDVLVIAGKGHETGQIIGNAIIPFNDAEEARHAAGEELAS